MITWTIAATVSMIVLMRAAIVSMTTLITRVTASTRDWIALLSVPRSQEMTGWQVVSIARATASTGASTTGATALTAISIIKAIASIAGWTTGATVSIGALIGKASASTNVMINAPIASSGVAPASKILILVFAEAPRAGAFFLVYSVSALRMSSQRRVS
jgi:hypothetical protein